MVFERSKGFMALAFLIASSHLSSALPIDPRDFKELELADLEARQTGGSCYAVTLEQIKALPAWGKIEQYAKDNYGEGGVNIVTNPSEYPDRDLKACIQGNKIPVEFAGKPECISSKKKINGQSLGTESRFKYTAEIGIEQTNSWTVTQASTFTAGAKFGVTVGVPGIGATAETFFQTTIHNEKTTSFSATNSHKDKVELEFWNKDGKQCNVDLVTQQCAATAKGRAPVVASGFVWFNYDDKRAAKGGGSEHYKWNVHIDSVLSEAERTSFIEFQGPMSTTSTTTYDTNCTKEVPKKDDKSKKPASKPAAPGGKGDPKAPKSDKPQKGKPAPGKKPAPKKPAPAKPAPKKPAPGKPAAKPAGKPTKKR